ncbi:MAG: beta-ketoacyl synthase N-terminal-like domain-containing protein [Pseudomonadota bacterium]
MNSPVGQPVYVAAASALSAAGWAWRGLARQVATGSASPEPTPELIDSHGRVLGFAVPSLPSSMDVESKARKLMSPPARLAAVALGLALRDADWPSDTYLNTGMYMGVGASNGALSELTAMLDASIEANAFSLERFGDAGLSVCNPLVAFQLMNNFTLCHGAILQGLGGPNSAYHSRGQGTVTALAEAHWQVASGQCPQALAGGADSALHPVVWDQLRRDRLLPMATLPGEGAAWLALSRQPRLALARLAAVACCPLAVQKAGDDEALPAWLTQVFGHSTLDEVVLAAPQPRARERLRKAVTARGVARPCTEITEALGETLAAGPALAWCVAVDLLQVAACQRVGVLSLDLDGRLGAVLLEAVP